MNDLWGSGRKEGSMAFMVIAEDVVPSLKDEQLRQSQIHRRRKITFLNADYYLGCVNGLHNNCRLVMSKSFHEVWRVFQEGDIESSRVSRLCLNLHKSILHTCVIIIVLQSPLKLGSLIWFLLFRIITPAYTTRYSSWWFLAAWHCLSFAPVLTTRLLDEVS